MNTVCLFIILLGSVSTIENQSGPVFQRAIYVFSVVEAAALGTVIGEVKATDRDSSLNGRIRYSLLDNGSGLFSVDSRTGLIITKAVLDYETQVSVTLTVKASDGGTGNTSESTAKVFINILDINDEGPIFSQANYTFAVQENLPIGSIIGLVKATDRDSGTNGMLRYAILNSGPSHLFSVDSITGQITSIAALDREVQDSVTLTVSAADLGPVSRSASAVVNINIVDVNDNAPIFSAANYMFVLSDRAPIGTRIGQVFATDFDMGANGMITYSLKDDGASLQFAIDDHTGQITVVSALTSRDVNFTVCATDNGLPAFSSDAQVLVQISADIVVG
ncbi:protocadherin-11 X-linked [Aplysia californica]|uniref:Protocadherin-11 X-linked n=1 Tax=Aplysia californica TaxID=6500 RepID=A0ABM0ZWR6_APLCA|nr:protocadherin-11 X-linked [Aplysia californica]